MAKQLEGPRIKIQRARHHIEDAEVAICEFISRRPMSSAVEADDDQAYNRIVMTGAEPIPGTLSPIIGDAIHNLRSALDHVALVLFRSRGIKDKKIQFPIASTKKLAHDYQIVSLRSANRAAAAVLDGVKPYRGGNLALYGLHKIDIVDKHRLLVPIGRIPAIRAPSPSFIGSRGIVTILIDRGISRKMIRGVHTGEYQPQVRLTLATRY